jgi:hypothetical protein
MMPDVVQLSPLASHLHVDRHRRVNIANPIESALREAGAKHWCTKAMCSTCGATEFRQRLAPLFVRDATSLAESIGSMDLSVWYSVEHVGGAIALVFNQLSDPQAVDSVLGAWRSRIHGHTRIIDSVVFHLVRRRLPSAKESAAWLGIARDEALETLDPSLLETLAYALNTSMASDPDLLAAANRQRRGYSPLHRALIRVVDSVAPEV